MLTMAGDNNNKGGAGSCMCRCAPNKNAKKKKKKHMYGVPGEGEALCNKITMHTQSCRVIRHSVVVLFTYR